MFVISSVNQTIRQSVNGLPINGGGGGVVAAQLFLKRSTGIFENI